MAIAEPNDTMQSKPDVLSRSFVTVRRLCGMAVEKAVVNAKKTLVHDHIDHCLEHAVHDCAGG